MAKNKKFKRTYKFTVEGVATNDYLPTVLDPLFTATGIAVENQWKQAKVTLEIEGDNQ